MKLRGVVPSSRTSWPTSLFPCITSPPHGFLSSKNTIVEKDGRTFLLKKIVAKNQKSVAFLRPFRVVNQLHRGLLTLTEPSRLITQLEGYQISIDCRHINTAGIGGRGEDANCRNIQGSQPTVPLHIPQKRIQLWVPNLV